MKVDIQQLINGMFDYVRTLWRDKVNDPEGHNSQRGTKFEAKKANNIEEGVDLAHERLNDVVTYLEQDEIQMKNIRFEFLLLKASVTSGLTTNILVDDFSSADAIILSGGVLDTVNQRIYLP